MAKKKSKKRQSPSISPGVIRMIVSGVVVVVVLAMCGGVVFVGVQAFKEAREAARRAQERSMAGGGGTNSSPALDDSLSAASRNETKSRLQRMGLGLHNFHDTHSHFPPLGTVAEPYHGETPQAWMTDLLPYVDQMGLYNSINRKAEWTDPLQGNAFKTVVANYLNPSAKMNTDASGYALAFYAANSRVITDSKLTTFSELLDGGSNTMLAGTITDGFLPWGNPMNHRDGALGFGGGPQAFGAPYGGIALVLMADGSVKAVRNTIAPDVALKLADPADGQPIDWDREVPK